MYYREKIINGIWHYKTHPRMEWKPMSVERLTKKIAAQEHDLNKLIIHNVDVSNGALCDVCGSDDIIEAPSMGMNCNSCNPL